MSTPFPVQVGTNYKDSFYMKNKTTNAPVTGKVQGDFTIQISRGTTGNVSTTGFTITEVSAANNPGQYDVVALGSTSFTSATAGKYFITIRLTADEAYTFEQTVLVTSNGDFDGTSGAASFTATASDGRITDGSNPLTGVTVRIQNSVNTVLAQLTSSATGLWGPVFLDNGTYTIVAQKSGYTVNNSNQITVSANVATGPLADVTLTAATSATSILCSDLTAYARVQARNVYGTQAQSTLLQSVNSAIAWVASAHNWNYYKTHGDIALQASYSTGTIAINNASTTVTLTTGTWPSWAASGWLLISGKIYRIASRSSGSVVLLATAWQAASISGTSFTIFQCEYSLPADCAKFGRPYPGQAWGSSGAPVGFEEIMALLHGLTSGQAYPEAWAVHGSGATAKLIFYPYITTANLLPFWYYRKPAALVSDSDTADVDPLHLELFHRAIDYQVALRFESCVAGNPEKCLERLKECLRRYTDNDKGPTNPSGPLGMYRNTGPVNPRLSG